MENKQTAVEWLKSIKEKYQNLILIDFVEAKNIEKERASTFAIRVISECCTIKDGKGEVNMQKFEALLTEMYGE